jgi:ABC-type lipoprotein release transport system permease subunit
MIIGIAWKNFTRQGIRAILNVLVTALAMIAVVFNISLYNGFQSQATRNMIQTDVAGGHYRAPGFDILTPTEWEDHTLKVPEQLQSLSPSEKAEVLVQQGQLYPNRRLYPVQLRGIDKDQTLLDLPLVGLKPYPETLSDVIPAVLGVKMSKKAHLKKGDTVVLKWRDRFGVVDARDLLIVDVVAMVNPRIDEGVVWLRLDHLQAMTQRAGEVSWVAVKSPQGPVSGMEFQSVNDLVADILNLIEQDRRYAKIFWVILVFMAAIGVFNTQILNVFKRQKEIGTLMALGMTSAQIVGIFTLEGSIAALISVFVALGLGAILFSWFQSVGLDISHLSESTIPVSERILLDIHPDEVFYSIAVIVCVMVLVSWAPVRKITRLDPTLALRGRAIT